MEINNIRKTKKIIVLLISVLILMLGVYFTLPLISGEQPDDSMVMNLDGSATESSDLLGSYEEDNTNITLSSVDVMLDVVPSNSFTTTIRMPINLDKSANISSVYPVLIKRTLVSKGSRVEEGQPLAELDLDFISKAVSETRSSVLALKEKVDSLKSTSLLLASIHDTYKGLERESKDVFESVKKIKDIAKGANAIQLLEASEAWSESLVLREESAIRMKNTDSELVSAQENLNREVERLNFYEYKLQNPFILSSENGFVSNIFPSSSMGETVHFSILQANLDRFRISIPKGLYEDNNLVKVSINGEHPTPLSILQVSKGRYNEYIAVVDVSNHVSKNWIEVNFLLTWESDSPVLKTHKDSIVDSEFIWTISSLSKKSSATKIKVRPFYYEGAETVLVKITQDIEPDFNIVTNTDVVSEKVIVEYKG